MKINTKRVYGEVMPVTNYDQERGVRNQTMRDQVQSQIQKIKKRDKVILAELAEYRKKRNKSIVDRFINAFTA